ncbi:replication factor C large subunit [Candidatus Woesearchaeota archaeon]|nr:replication factor C large subunit [Candidatus Woesearchaeota archaeon]
MTVEPFIVKNIPKTSNDIKGQDKGMLSLKRAVAGFSRGGKAMLLHGPTGTGKTSAVIALANELDYELIEVNASSKRNKDQIESIIGAATSQMSLFGNSKIILIDDIDGLSGREDRGGAATLAKLIPKSSFPIVMTCIDAYSDKLKPVKKVSEAIEFHTLNYLSVANILKKVCDSEGIGFEDDAIKTLARMSGGDARAAINDLQMISANKKAIVMDDVKTMAERDYSEKITSALMKVFKTSDFDVAISAYNNIEEDYDKVMLWLDENIPKEYEKNEDIARAYEMMSRADVYKGRIRRRQHWRFLVYINALLSAGIASSKDEKYKKFTKYVPSMRLLKIWQANMKYNKRKGICGKIASKTRSSTKYAMDNVYPFMKFLVKGNGSRDIIDFFDFDKEELAFLIK